MKTIDASLTVSWINRALFLSAFLAIFLFSDGNAQAQSTWTGSTGSTDWATPANWGGTAPSSGATLIFTSANASSTNLLTESLTSSTFVIGSITFTSGAIPTQ